MPENTKTINLFQDEKTGKLLEFIHKHDEDYAKVKDTSGSVMYVPLDHLVPYDKDKGRLAKIAAPHVMPEPEEQAPERVVPLNETAEQIQQRLPGVGYATAKRIIELRLSLSGERFSNLKQLENIPRVNWEQLIKDDLIFIG